MRPELIGSVVQQTWGEGQVSSNGSEFESSYYSCFTQRACEVWRTDTGEGSLVVDALGPILTRSVITLIDVDFTVGSGPAGWTDTFIGTWSIDTLRSVLTGPNNQTLVDFCITVFARPSRGTATGVGPKTVVTRGPVLTGRYRTHSLMLLSHLSPVNPGGHVHLKLPTRFSQVAPFRHGLFRHSSVSLSQFLPDRPGGH